MAILIPNLCKEEDGAAIVEYLLLVSLIAVVCILGIAAVGNKVGDQYTGIAAKVP